MTLGLWSGATIAWAQMPAGAGQGGSGGPQRAYSVRLAGPGEYGQIKRLMAADQGRAFSDQDLSAVRHDLEPDDELEFYLLEEQGRPVGTISMHVDEVVTFRGYYFEPGKKDVQALVRALVDLLDQKGKDGRVTVCPSYAEVLPVYREVLGDRMTEQNMTDAGDWVAVTIRHQPSR